MKSLLLTLSLLSIASVSYAQKDERFEKLSKCVFDTNEAIHSVKAFSEHDDKLYKKKVAAISANDMVKLSEVQKEQQAYDTLILDFVDRACNKIYPKK